MDNAILTKIRALGAGLEPPLPFISPDDAARLGPVTIAELSEYGIDAVTDADGNRFRVRNTRRLERTIVETMHERQIAYHQLIGMRLVAVKTRSSAGSWLIWEIR